MQPWMLGLLNSQSAKVRGDYLGTWTSTSNINTVNTSNYSIAAPEDNKIFVVCIFANGSSSLDFASNNPRASFKLNGTTVLNNVALNLAHKRAPNANLNSIYYYDLSGIEVNQVGFSFAFNEVVSRSGLVFFSLSGVDSVAPGDTAEGAVSDSSVSASIDTLLGGVTIGSALRQVNTTGTLDPPFGLTVYDGNPESAVRWLVGVEENTPTTAGRTYTATWGSSGGGNIVIANWR